jgi:membrane-associated phospholipid phosphatase
MHKKQPYNTNAVAHRMVLPKKKGNPFFIPSLVSIIILIVIVYQIFYKNNNAFDNFISKEISLCITSARTEVILFFTLLGSHKFLIPAWVMLALLYCFLYKEKLGAAKILGIGIFNLIIMFSLKFLFNRPRPGMALISEVPGLSFPSGHALMGSTFFSIVIYFVYRNVKNVFIKNALLVLLVFTILMIGFSRIYLRLHYTTDVIAGYCFGMLSFSFFYYVQNIFNRKNKSL